MAVPAVLAEATALEERWRVIHRESLATLRQVCAQSDAGSVLEPGFLAELPSIALQGLREAEAWAREEHGASVARLREQVCAHEVLLEDMYAALRQARADVAALGQAAAADRGEHGLGCSPADRCSALATTLRAYEAELQLKQTSTRSLRLGMPAAELQALLVAWELQPQLESVDAMRAGLAANELLAAS